MRIEGFFLASRAGRRIFWTLMLAATVPIVLLGASTYDSLQDQSIAQAQRQRTQATKYAGLSLLDNLLVARTVLGVFARTGIADKESLIGNRRGRVLVGVAGGTMDGQLVAGDAALWQRWRQAAAFDWPYPQQTSVARIVLSHEPDREGPMPVLLGLRLPEQPQRVWVGEVDAGYLFGELSADATGERICVTDAHEHALFCPTQATLQALRGAEPAGGPPLRWNLFLRSDFGVDDWTLVNLTPAGVVAAGLPLGRMLVLGTLATVLIVVMLSLVQVRRTMVPLEQLLAGTRRLSQRDYAARVAQHSRDEFGELAQSFNEMAQRIGSQVQAMEVQSSIDGEILSGLNLERIFQRVGLRVAQILPQTRVAVVAFDSDLQSLARVYPAEGSVRVASLARADVEGLCNPCKGVLQPMVPPPSWVARTLRGPAPWVQVVRVFATERLIALIVVAGDEAVQASPEVERELLELRDRVGVALAAADRERRLVERATTDSLTGLANRGGMLEHLARRLESEPPIPCSLLFVDLDRFKDVNDTLGHQAGDELLRTVARRLCDLVPPDTLVARPSGDEFVVVVDGTRADAEQLARSIVARLAKPIALGDKVVTVGASVGMARHPDHGLTEGDLIRRADVAMYRVKARGGHGASWFEEASDERLSGHAAMRMDLAEALARNEFELHYQPRVSCEGGRIRSVEALLRWRHRTLGLVPPDRFIELLEEGHLIHDVGSWVIETACRQLLAWRSKGIAVDAVAVNVSTRQLHAPDFADRVIEMLERCGLPPSSLELEITESVFMGEATAAIASLQSLFDSGVHLALDDFGTGYSSLSYLHRLPISTLKVDRSFVSELGVRDSALSLTRAIVALARALHLHVVAEGVETHQQAELLRGLRCDELQGYLFSRPLPADQLATYALRGGLPQLAAPVEPSP